MGIATTFPLLNPNLSMVAVHGTITIGAAGVVGAYTCSDGVVTKIAATTGRYLVTLGRTYPQGICGAGGLRRAVAVDDSVVIGEAHSGASFEVRYYDTTPVLADPANGTIIDFVMFYLKGSSLLHKLLCNVKDLRVIGGAFFPNGINPNVPTGLVGKGVASVSAPSAGGIFTITTESPFSELVAGFASVGLVDAYADGDDMLPRLSVVTPAAGTVEISLWDVSAAATHAGITADAHNFISFLLFVRGTTA